MTHEHGNMTKGEVCAEYYKVVAGLRKRIDALEAREIDFVVQIDEARKLAEDQRDQLAEVRGCHRTDDGWALPWEVEK